tara:strand:- start:92 stop:343 length:252 start_codon:yes stop_codon:yes gene_type:complete
MPYTQTFIVTCKQLPLDMLRYDRCYPFDNNSILALISQDFNKIAQESFNVRLSRIMLNKNDTLTIDRWNSFGCSISDIHVTKL